MCRMPCPMGGGVQGLQPLGIAGQAAHLSLVPAATGARATGKAPTSVSLFDQGLTQVLQASVTGLVPKQAYVLALAARPDGSGPLEPLSAFMTNPAGSAIVNADRTDPADRAERCEGRAPLSGDRAGTAAKLGRPVQVQVQ